MKAPGKRTLLATLSLSLALVLALGAWNIGKVESAREKSVREYTLKKGEYAKTVLLVEALAKSATTTLDWDAVAKSAETLPPEWKKRFTDLADTRRLELFSDERDRLLANAGELFSANENDPGVKENVARALVLQSAIEEIMKKKESISGNAEWNGALEYRKAYEQYRKLAFLSKDQSGEALDYLDQASKNLQKSLLSFPKDNRVELAIEFIYKRTKDEEAKSGYANAPGRPRAMPPQKSTRDSPGAGGQDRPRRH